MRNFVIIFLSILLLGTTVQFLAKAQTNLNQYNVELKEAFSNRTENEKKVSSTLFCQIFRYSKALSDGKSENEALKYFSPKISNIDDQGRLLIMVRIKPGILNETSYVKNVIVNSGGIKIQEEIGHNGCVEVSSWMPINKILNLTAIESVGFIDKIYPAIKNGTTAVDILRI